MMSRACAGLVAGHIVVSLPGSEAAVRLAMERLLIPELGHLVQQAAQSDDAMRPFTSTISLDEARARLDAARPADRAHRARARSRTRRGRVAAADVDVADRRAAVRAIRDGRLRRDRRGHGRAAPIGAAPAAHLSIASTPAQPSIVDGRARHLRGDRHRRAAAGRRRRRRDGRGDRDAAATDAIDILRRGDGRAEHRPARRDIAAGDRVVAAGDVLTPSRVGALAAIGCADVEVFAKPRVAILSTGNEVVEPGSALRAGQIYDVNRFTLGAIVAPHGGIAEPHRAGAGHGRRARRGARRLRATPTSSCFPAAARSASAI